MNDISSNIKKVMFIFLLCFIAVISYITYFEIFVGPKIVRKPQNRRLWVERNKVLRGTITDRNGNPLTKSTKIDQESQKREYTGGAVFAHALGYCDPRYGLTGLESKYDQDLMADDLKIDINFFAKDKEKKEEKVGHSLRTTLDSNLQKLAFDLLGDNRGAVVAINPKTGEVLAMVSKPSFDPNDLKGLMTQINNADKNAEILKHSPLINRVTQGLYPPGSTFKTVTAVSAIENMNNIMTRRINDTGKLPFNSKESLSNYEGEVLGNIGFKEAYTLSSNVYFGGLGLELGNDKLKSTAEKFFFNKDTPADGITIENSMFPTLKKNEKGNLAQSAIGQGSVLASPMQMALVTCTIANDGVMMKPHLVKDIINSKGKVIKEIAPESNGNIISAQTAKTMQDLMRSVVANGTGTAANLQGLNVCGKTGTADNRDSKGNAMPPHSWFISFAPKDDPKVAVVVIVENGGTGGGKAASIAAKIIQSAVNIK